MTRAPKRELSSATELTSIIASPADQYAKVRWNFGRHLAEVSAGKPNVDSAVYSAIDFAKVVDWIAPQGHPERAKVFAQIRWIDAIRTIANVAKHAKKPD